MTRYGRKLLNTSPLSLAIGAGAIAATVRYDSVPNHVLRSVELKHLVLLTLCGVILLLSPSSSYSDEVDEVLSAWQKRQSQVRTLRLVARGEGLYKKGSYSDEVGLPSSEPLPAEDLRFECRALYLLDFEQNRVRKETSTMSFNSSAQTFHKGNRIVVFDGQDVQQYVPRSTNSALSDVDINLDIFDAKSSPENIFMVSDLPVSFAAGCIPSNAGNMSHRKLRIELQLGDLKAFGESTNHDLVLRSQPLHGRAGSYLEYWVDRDRGATITQWHFYLNETLIFHFSIKYKESADEWWPDSWTYREHSADGTVAKEFKMIVETLETNIPTRIDDFRIRQEEGMHVADRKTGEEYQVTADGKRPRAEVLRGVEQQEETSDEREETPPAQSWIRWAVVVGVIAVGITAVSALRR